MKIRIGEPTIKGFNRIIFSVLLQNGAGPDDDEDELLCICFQRAVAERIQKALEATFPI